jgi:Transposase DNA-binding/Transposase Tn5 dimerisation domain
MSSQADDRHWAVIEFADAELGDARRTQRLVERAGVLAPHPTAALPAACGDDAMLTAASRFFDNDAIEPPDVLHSHIEATSHRLEQVPLVLAGQETTEVDWTAHPATKHLGPWGHTACQGLLVHSTLAFTPERVPLGLVAQQVWARDPDDVGTRTRRKQLPIRQKESQKWLASLDAVCSARAACPQTRCVSGGDREAAVYDLLMAERPAGVALLVRASWERGVSAPQRSVWAAVAAQPVVAPLLLQGPRRGVQPARDAPLALRFCPLTLCAPRHRKAERLPEVTLGAVQGREIEPPPEAKPIEWLLLPTVAVHTGDDARERGPWYSCRWGIEVWHRILKSGCHIEARPLATGERLERCLTLYSVMAWRIFYAIMLARAVPEMPCAVLLDIEEWQALYCALHHCPTPPERPPSLGEAVRWIAQLGGFGGRRRRDQPGPETLWRGLQHLTDLTKMYRILRSAPP